MKVVLLCSAGMSTSLLVEKLKKEAIAKEVTLDVEAFPASAVNSLDLANINIILIGPQASYERPKVLEAVKGYKIAVDVIAMMDYGMMDAEKILQDIIKMYAAL